MPPRRHSPAPYYDSQLLAYIRVLRGRRPVPAQPAGRAERPMPAPRARKLPGGVGRFLRASVSARGWVETRRQGKRPGSWRRPPGLPRIPDPRERPRVHRNIDVHSRIRTYAAPKVKHCTRARSPAEPCEDALRGELGKVRYRLNRRDQRPWRRGPLPPPPQSPRNGGRSSATLPLWAVKSTIAR